jgi:hypothetical protein
LSNQLATTSRACTGVSRNSEVRSSILIVSGRFDTNYYMNPAPFLPTTHFLMPRSMTPKDGVPITGESISERFTTWMSPPPPSPKSITPSPISGTEREGGIDWEDVRVQAWSGTERHDNGEFIEKSVELNKAIKSMQVSISLP